MRKAYLLILLLLFVSGFLRAQQASVKLFSVDFQQAKIDQVVNEIESKSTYHFYYDPVVFDSLRVTLQATDKPLATILDMAFKNTVFHYAITNRQQVFLTRGKEVRTQLAVGYSLNAHISAQNQAATPADYSYETEKKVAEATTENKLYEIGIKTNTIKAGSATLCGYIRDIKSGEPVVGASINNPATKAGVASDQFGYYTLTMPRGRHVLTVRGLGMRDTRRQIVLYSDGKLNIEMQEQVNSLKEVKISADKVANVRSTEMSVERLDVKSIKEIPTAFGETDVLKAVLTLPGVTTVGEATTGFNVRGGSADENLILLNGSTIYNPSHFFGFFAAFNPDIVKDIELYKSSIPEKYGGRLASVLEVTDREGNDKIYTGSAGIGLLTSRFNIEGPIVDDKTSFIFGARTSYSDWLLKLLPQAYKNSSASFYDMNLDISHQFGDKDKVYLSSYISHDNFRLNSDTTYAYGNKNINLKWKHNYNTKLFSLITVGYDRYDYSVSSTQNPVNGYDLTYNINQSNFRADFTWYINNKNTIDFGLTSTYYLNNPGNYEPDGNGSLVIPQVIAAEHALESALYLGDKYDVNTNLSISAGLRFNVYNYLGSQIVDYYAANLPHTADNVVDSVDYKSGQVIKTYAAPDVRVSARYLLNENLSVKAGYNTLHQYIHQLTNSTAISPTDIYKMSDPNIKPEWGDQASIGLFQNLDNNTLELSVETYYKRLRNIPDYRSGAVLVLNEHVEQDLINDDGKAYGVEFLMKKTAGKLTGWISYTYSRTLLQQNDPNAGELINGGAWYPADYDKPNSFNFTGNYAFTHRYSFSVDVAYSTGRPITLPIAKYEYAGSERVYYSDRNEYRIPDYFRSDISIIIDGNHRVHQRFHNSWSFGVYNLTGRANAYSTFFTEQGGVISGYKLSIFATPIPFINYNVRF